MTLIVCLLNAGWSLIFESLMMLLMVLLDKELLYNCCCFCFY